MSDVTVRPLTEEEHLELHARYLTTLLLELGPLPCLEVIAVLCEMPLTLTEVVDVLLYSVRCDMVVLEPGTPVRVRAVERPVFAPRGAK
jgi:hypothetical protein